MSDFSKIDFLLSKKTRSND